MLQQVLVIGLGGFLGSICRYGMSMLMNKWLGSVFPYGTMAVNLIGCFLMGILYGLLHKELLGLGTGKSFWMAGFCGAFTTFSTFSMDGLTLLSEGRFSAFLLYTAISVIAGLGAVYLGLKIIQ